MAVRRYTTPWEKRRRRGLIVRILLYGILFAVCLYFNIPALWWFMIAAILGGLVVAFAIRRFKDREGE